MAQGYRPPDRPIVVTAWGSSLRVMKKVIVLLVIAAIAAAAWKIMTTEVDADASA